VDIDDLIQFETARNRYHRHNPLSTRTRVPFWNGYHDAAHITRIANVCAMRISRARLRFNSVSFWNELGSKRTVVLAFCIVVLFVTVVRNLPVEVDTDLAVSSPERKEIGDSDPYIDFISVGSLTKPDLQRAQQASFGSQRAVRNFIPVTELNDTDATCYKTLTQAQVNEALNFCKNTQGQSRDSRIFRQRLQFFRKRAPGWLCAQKRPLDGLRLALERYKSEVLPHYLVVIDDDSYLNMESLVVMLKEKYPPGQVAVIGGCIYTFPQELNFTFPVGGFGSILTRKTVENLLRPIYCDTADPDGFTNMACWRLSQNLVGEKRFFREGMSVADLMYRYSAELPFTDMSKWTDGHGFCFHSDHVLGYFIGYYHVGVPDEKLDAAQPNDQLRSKNWFSYTTIDNEKQCKNERQKCGATSLICHYVSSEQMDTLYARTDQGTNV
jgi:hypothetical protein